MILTSVLLYYCFDVMIMVEMFVLLGVKL